MAGRGMAPKDPESRRNAHPPIRGEWRPAPGIGWQHGEIPPPPAKITAASRRAWGVWMRAWFASYWTPDDLPALRQVIRIYDQVERGEFQRATELRYAMDGYGITPKGQQDRRWAAPLRGAKPGEAEPDDELEQPVEEPTASPYAGLQVIEGRGA